MFNFHHRYCNLLFIFIILLSFVSDRFYAQAIGSIYSLEYPDDKIIHFGPFLQRDSAIMSFVVQTYTGDSLSIFERSPTFIIEATTPGTLYQDFFWPSTSFPVLFHENKKADTIRVGFDAMPNRPLGRKDVRLVIGLLDNKGGLTHADTFYLVGKSTSLYIDGYDDFVRFDSVFINQQSPVNLTWKVRNTNKSTPTLPCVEQIFNLISPPYNGNEFDVEQKNYPLPVHFSADNKVYKEWIFSYSPKDTLTDSAEFRLLFQPQPGSTDTAKVKLYGIGVTQFFEIINHNAEQIIEDTIDIGRVSVGNSKTLNVTLRNRGNVRYKATTQTLLHEIDDVPARFFSINKRFCENANSLFNNDTGSFQIEFRADEKGEFFARYVIENDFEARGIRSNNKSDYRKTFIIKGTGVTPQLRFLADTIDFGNVNSANETSDCPIQRDTTLTLFNTGNADLRISDISSTNMMFQLRPLPPFTIPAGGSTNIVLTFSSNKNPALYTSDLIFSTNEPALPRATIALIANAIPPISAVLALPRLAAKPGTMLEIPITIKDIVAGAQTVTNYASSFDITLAFNSTLLLYNNHVTIGTASAGCSIDVDNGTAGQLRLSTSKLSSFQPSDTLLLLQFRTFLGNFRTTEIAIAAAKIGISDICDDYISLTLEDGEYAIDSICGLDYKTSGSAGQFDYSLSAPVASSELALSFTLPFSFPAKLEICNSLGDVFETHTFNLPQGEHKSTVSIAHYNAGTYYAVFSCGLYRKIAPFIKL